MMAIRIKMPMKGLIKAETSCLTHEGAFSLFIRFKPYFLLFFSTPSSSRPVIDVEKESNISSVVRVELFRSLSIEACDKPAD